jgi:hypothetical protein
MSNSYEKVAALLIGPRLIFGFRHSPILPKRVKTDDVIDAASELKGLLI